MLTLKSLSTAAINEFYKRHHYSARASKTDISIGGYSDQDLVIAARLIDYDGVFWLRSLFCDPSFRRQQHGLCYLSGLSDYLATLAHDAVRNADRSEPGFTKPIIAFADPRLNPLYDAASWIKLASPYNNLPKTLTDRIKSNSAFASHSRDPI